jgi:hypothetical protein
LGRRTKNSKFGKFKNTEWVSVCPACDASILTANGIEWPYQCSDGAMRTVGDFNPQTGRYEVPSLKVGCFEFSKSALDSAIAQQKSLQTTRLTEAKGKKLYGEIKAGTATADDCFAFSKSVHEWGGGGRVWGNLIKQGESAVRTQLEGWLTAVPGLDAFNALEKGIEIKGLQVSFASKHLRMLEPERFAVLDDVLSQGLGFATNLRGYEYFMENLHELRRAYVPHESIAYVEAGLFLLVRQGVRSVTKDV